MRRFGPCKQRKVWMTPINSVDLGKKFSSSNSVSQFIKFIEKTGNFDEVKA